MRINTNVASMTAQANNAQVNKNLTNSLEKLSSGLRINKAADDASGMAIADKLRTQASSIGQGIANANSGNALIQIADKAMGEQSNILDIIKTKLIQATTSTTSEEGREAIRKDIVKLLDQLDQISATTNYNGINLLDEKGAQFSFQIGESAASKIAIETNYAINTGGLGAKKEVPVDSEANLIYGSAGSVFIKDDDTTLTVKNNATAAGNRAIVVGGTTVQTAAPVDSSINLTAKNVESIGITNTQSAAGVSVSLETDDQELINTLNSIAVDNAALTKNSDGNYTFASTAAATEAFIDFGGGKVDITNLKISGLASGTDISTNEYIVIETDDDVSVTKLSGVDEISIDSGTMTTSTAAANRGSYQAGGLTTTLEGNGSTNPDGILYGGTAGEGVKIDSGTATVQVDQRDAGVVDASIAINAIQDTATNTEGSFVVTADEVEKITLTMTNGTGSVVMTTEDLTTMSKLNELAQYDSNLTRIQDGMYSFTATGANADAVLEFGSEKVNISNLTFSNVQNGTAAGLSEAIFIQTDSAVTVTKNGVADDLDITLEGATGTTVGQAFKGVLTDAASTSGSLAGLKALTTNQLTADIANDYMANVDEAINQINDVRSQFGSTQNQLEAAIRNMMVTQVNIKSAESVIRDVDYAAESANFNKQNIISQAGTYALSQANNVQQNVMKLLQ